MYQILRSHVPYAFQVRPTLRVPWLLLCSWLYAQQDDELPNMNQRCILYSAEWDVVLPATRSEWAGERPERQRRRHRGA